MKLFRLVPSFFAFDPLNIHSIRERLCHLVKWGFTYSEARRIPIDELNEFIDLINEYYVNKKKAMEGNGESTGAPEPKSIGQVNPTMF